MPGALSYPMNMARYDWGYRSEPEPHLGDRRLACPQGKVIGGSSSINGNLNAPSIMVGEKASDHILGREPPTRSTRTPWINPGWRESAR